ncbi:MAG: TonB-dependent receptor plug domain-containing protein [Alphaproteobacteria bacterium]|nr:TonB-dependent receptor plug domain-containing protein [Alphaproteobacteria bacterium]
MATTSLVTLVPFAYAAGGDEIVVTARKREERLIDIPISATVISGDEIAQKGALTVDLNTIVSGIAGARFNNLADNSLSETSLRGAGAARGTNSEVGIGLFRDGIYAAGGFQFGRNVQRIDTFDLARVEVTRGANGALFGRNAVGGAINLITIKPQSEFGGRITADYQWDTEAVDTQLILNVPITDKISTRASVDWWHQEKGFICPPTLNRCSSWGQGIFGRGQIRYVDEALDVNLLIERQQQSGPVAYSALRVAPGAAPGYTVGYNDGKYNQHLDFPNPEKDVQNLNNAILTVGYDFDFAKLSWVSSFRDRHTFINLDLDRTSAVGVALANSLGNAVTGDTTTRQDLTDDTATWVSVAHLAGDLAGDKLHWLFGAEYLNQHGNYQVFQPTMNNASGARLQTDYNYKSIAPFATLYYDIFSWLKVGAEGRWTHDEKDAVQFRWTHPTAKPATPASDLSFDSNNTAYNFTISANVTPDAIVYVGIGSGYRAGGFNPNPGGCDFGLGATNCTVIPDTFSNEKSVSYEIGAKGEITDWLIGTFAAYKRHTNGVQSGLNNGCDMALMNCPDGMGGFLAPTMYVDNFGDANLWGVEVELSANFEFLGGTTRLMLDGSRQEGHYKGGPFDGNLVVQNPKWILGGNLHYTHAIPNTEASAFGNLNYSANYGGTQEIDGSFDLSDYNIFDARVGVDYGGWQFSVYAQNLTNYNYILLDTLTTERWSLPRIWGANVRYKW